MLLKNVKVLRPKTTKIQKRNGIGYVYQVIGKSYKKDKNRKKIKGFNHLLVINRSGGLVRVRRFAIVLNRNSETGAEK